MMGDQSIHFTSNSDEYETPAKVFDPLMKEFKFIADMACTAENSKCKLGVVSSLAAPWIYMFNKRRKNIIVWCNPPYSRGLQKKFLKQGAEAMKDGITSVFLVPARTDTKAWHTYIWDEKKHKPKQGVEVRFIKGRIKFEVNGKPVKGKNGKAQSAPFCSAIVIFKGCVNCEKLKGIERA